MKGPIAGFLGGGLFGAGLLISQMTNPSKVIGFLDFFGNWDPSLALVMASALLITFLGYRTVLRRPAPLLESEWSLPQKTMIDVQLVTGAALFGIGWGLSGLCPGPALSSVSFALPNILFFLAGMIGSVIFFRMLRRPA